MLLLLSNWYPLHWKVRTQSLDHQGIKYFQLKYVHWFSRHYALVHFIDHKWSADITHTPGKPKPACDLPFRDTRFIVRSGTQPAESARSAHVCSPGPVWLLLPVQAEVPPSSLPREEKAVFRASVQGRRSPGGTQTTLPSLGSSFIYCSLETGGPLKNPPLFTPKQ